MAISFFFHIFALIPIVGETINIFIMIKKIIYFFNWLLRRKRIEEMEGDFQDWLLKQKEKEEMEDLGNGVRRR